MDERAGAARPSPRPRPTPAAAPAAAEEKVAPVVEAAPAVVPDLAPSRGRQRRTRQPVTEPRFDPSSWGGAIIVMGVFVAILWAVQIANAHQNYAFDRYGLRPRTLHGLWGVLTGPFLHSSYDRLATNTFPLLLIGWVVLLAGWRLWVFVSVSVALLGEGLAWIVAPGGTPLVGASELYFGWLGYLIARAVFTRKIRWIVSAAMVLLFFGALLNQLTPVPHAQESWQLHACGFVVGAAAGWFLHPHRRRRRDAR